MDNASVSDSVESPQSNEAENGGAVKGGPEGGGNSAELDGSGEHDDTDETPSAGVDEYQRVDVDVPDGFAVYKNYGQGIGGKTAIVKIRSDSTVRLSEYVLREIIDGDEAVLALEGPDGGLAFKPVAEDPGVGFKIREGGVLKVSSVVDMHGLSVEEATQYHARWNDEHGVLVVEDPVEQ